MSAIHAQGKYHAMAAANHERAAQHYRQASKRYDEKDDAHAAHQSQIARWYAYRAAQRSIEKQHNERPNLTTQVGLFEPLIAQFSPHANIHGEFNS